MEKVGSLVPVNPHTTQVVTEQVVERISRQKAQAVWDPVCLVSHVSVVWLGLSAKLTDRLSTFLVRSGPDSQGNAVECMLGVLLQDECMVNAMGLAASSADLDIVGKASLFTISMTPGRSRHDTYPHCAVKSSGNLIVGLQTWTAAQDFWKPELAHRALHMLDLAMCRRRCFHPLRWLPANTTNHVGMGQCLWGRTVVRLGQGGRHRLSDT